MLWGFLSSFWKFILIHNDPLQDPDWELLLQQPRLALIGEGSSVRALGQQVLVSVLEGS